MTTEPQSDGAPTIGAALTRAATRWPDQDALVCDGVRLTYRELTDAVRRTAAALLAHGVRRGDRVAICMGNSATWLTLFYANALIGAVAVPVDPTIAAAALERRLRQSDSVLLATVDRLFDRIDVIAALCAIEPAIESALPGTVLPRLHTVAVLGRAVPRGALSYGMFMGQAHAGSLVDRDAVERAAAGVRPNDTVLLDDGAMPSHAGLLRDAAATAAQLGVQRGDRYFSAWPFHQAASVATLLAAPRVGACLVTTPIFEPGEMLRVLERERCCTVSADAPLLHDMTSHPGFDPTRLCLRDGLAPAPPRPST
ncbi:MAG: AMP-binding protein [Proteobacteria bacterium]|nr:AMP-binding protein [Pseudomonadota bacterium]